MSWQKTAGRSRPRAGQMPELNCGWGAGIAPDGNLFFIASGGIYSVPLIHWTKSGAPVYNLKAAHRIIREQHSVSGLYVNSQNRLFVAMSYEWNRGEKNALSCYTTDGRLLWNVAMTPPCTSNRTPAFRADDVNASSTIGEFDFPGAGHLGHVIGTWSWHGNERPYLLTSDGMYIGTPLPDKTMVGPAAVWGESYMYYFQAPDGAPYLVDGGADGDHILQIHGLQQAREFSQPLVITSTEAMAAKNAVNQPAAAPHPPEPVIRVAWPRHVPLMNGTLAGWNMNAGVSLNGGHGRTAQVALARDAKYLYLAYKVHEPTPPLTNKGGDWQDLFITGDCCDLMLGTNPKANPHRRHAAMGDIRLLLSEFQGKPIAVLYRPVTTHPKHPVTLLAATIDRITRLTDAKVAFHRYKGYYTLTARVPLADLGLSWNHGKTLRGDVGVIYADQTGRNRILRLYYYNHHTKIISDLTTEATLQPQYWGTVLMPAGPNLLKNGSFDKTGFKTDPHNGWKVVAQSNGGHATIVSRYPHSGRYCLLLKLSHPVVYAPAEFYRKNYGKFEASGNGGKGSAWVSVQQMVSVRAGGRYYIRMFYRARGLRPELQGPGPNRGYAFFEPSLTWLTRNNRYISGLGINSYLQYPINNGAIWHQLTSQTASWHVQSWYVAPPGAAEAVIALQMRITRARVTPYVYIDDVEFTRVHSRQSQAGG